MALLAPYRRQDAPSSAIRLIGDIAAMQLLMAWTTATVTWTIPTERATPASERELWDWLWRGVTVDFDAIAVQAGLPAYLIEKQLEALARARLIYPDGTASDWAKAVVEAEIGRRYGGMRPNPPPALPPKPTEEKSCIPEDISGNLKGDGSNGDNAPIEAAE